MGSGILKDGKTEITRVRWVVESPISKYGGREWSTFTHDPRRQDSSTSVGVRIPRWSATGFCLRDTIEVVTVSEDGVGGPIDSIGIFRSTSIYTGVLKT